jgi:FkbM family methyltransferase
MHLLKRLAATLPDTWQQRLRSARSRAQIRRGTFHADEPEFDRLPEWLNPGDCALDIGANMGSYTVAMSRLVGRTGRVIALEPIPDTFAILVSNLQAANCSNVTAINAAASDRTDVKSMHVPRFDSGLENFYEARLAPDDQPATTSVRQILTLALDSLNLPQRIALAKIDVEGHEKAVISGIWKLIQRDLPVLIIETTSPVIEQRLAGLNYRVLHRAGSPNRVFLPAGRLREGAQSEPLQGNAVRSQPSQESHLRQTAPLF